MTDRDLLKQALEALEDACGGRCNAEHNPCWQREVAAALSERLAQPEQELKPWQTEETYDNDGVLIARRMKRGPNCEWEPWLTPPRREWAGLDRKEMLSIIDQQQAYKETGLPMFYRDQCLDMLRAIEAKLKEKNGRVDSFLRRLLDPEDLGHAVSHEVRQKVRELL